MAKAICQSCKDDRLKKGLKPMERITLPPSITDSPSFWRPKIRTYVCSHCDGDSLVTSALRAFAQRQAT